MEQYLIKVIHTCTFASIVILYNCKLHMASTIIVALSTYRNASELPVKDAQVYR